MCNFVPITVSADGLAPSGARSSAGIVVTKFMLHTVVKKQFDSWKGYSADKMVQEIRLIIFQSIICSFPFHWSGLSCMCSDIQPSISLQLYTISLIILSHIGLDDTCINEPNHYWYESIYLNEISINI